MNLLNYVSGDSCLHKLNPITKLLIAFLYGIACILCNNVFGEIAFIIFMIFVSYLSGIGERALRLTKNLLILGLLMFVIQLFSVRTGAPLLKTYNFVWFTTGGLESACLLSLRVVATMLPLMMLFAITQMNDLCNALVQKAHVPYRYAFIVTTAFRFVPIFTTEFHDIQDAQKARGVDYDTKNFIRKLQLIAPLCVPLLVSSLKKVNSSAISSEMRGFNFRTRTSGYKQYPFSARDFLVTGVVICLIAISILFLK